MTSAAASRRLDAYTYLFADLLTAHLPVYNLRRAATLFKATRVQ